MADPAPNATRDILAGIRVLVVDDQPSQLPLTARVLADAGAQVQALSSGQEAFDAVHERAPDVLIVDLGLRNVSGTTLVRHIRKLPGTADMAIIAFTADGGSKREEAIQSGVEYYVAKPDFSRLIHVLRHALGR
jgi:CheY-like chemotaxis protein